LPVFDLERAFGLCLLLLFAPLAVRAQDAQGSADPAGYQHLVSEAVSEYNQGNWAEARALFEQAHALSPNARTERGIGLTAFELRDYVDAITQLQTAIDDERNPLSAEQRAQASEIVARAQRYVGTVHIDLAPQSAQLLLNGRLVDKCEFVLNVGDYDLAAKAPGYADASLKLNVEGGKTSTVRLELVPMSAGNDTQPVPGGATDRATTSAPGTTQRILGWTAVGVGAVALTLGIVFEIQRSSKVSDRDAICPSGKDCSAADQRTIDDLTGQAKTASTVGIVGLVSGIVFGAGGAALLLTAPSSERPSQVSVAPIVSPLAQGVMVTAHAW
jgi:tetratricopeptide (TPR) repeat protein